MPPIDPSLIPPQQNQGLATPPGQGNIPITPAYRLQAQQAAIAHANQTAGISEGNEGISAGHLDLAKQDMQIKREEFKQKYGYYPDQPPPAQGSPEDPNTPVGEDFLKTKDPGYANIVRGFVQGRVPPGGSFSFRSPQYFQLLKDAATYEPGFDLTAFKRRQAAFSSFMAGPDGRAMDRVNQALQHLKIWYDNAKNLNNYHEGLLATPGNAAHVALLNWEKNPLYTKALLSRDAVATELAAAFKGGNDPALASLDHWQKVLSLNNSPEGFDGAAQTAAQLLGGRIDASTFRFKQAVGPSGDAYSLISPQAKKNFDIFTDPNFGTPAVNTDQKQLSTTQQAKNFPPGYQAEHQAFIANNRGKLTPQAYTDFRKQMDQKYGINEGPLNPDEVNTFINNANKGAPTTAIPAQNINLSADQAHEAKVAANPAMIGLASGANAAALGLPELVAGQQGREAFNEARKEDWKSSAFGDLVGSVIGMGGLERLGAKGLQNLADRYGTKTIQEGLTNPTARTKLLGDIAVNTGYGGTRGFNEADTGQGGEGLVEGAGGGALGALGGNFVTRGVNPLISDSLQAAKKLIPGVKTTTLQKLGLGGAEEAVSGIPGIGTARGNTLVSFNKDNTKRALDNIANLDNVKVDTFVPNNIQPGTASNKFMNDKFDEAYNAISPNIAGTSTAPFEKANKTLVGTMTDQAPAKVNAILKKFTDANGHYSGQSYQDVNRALRELQQDFGTQAEAGVIGARDNMRAIGALRQQITDHVGTQNPSLMNDLQSINKGYAHAMRIEDATSRAVANGGGIYSPGQYLNSIKKLDLSAHGGKFAQGEALDQPYGEAVAKVLGSGTPKKLSPKETAIGATALGMGGYATGGVLPVATFGTGLALYTPGVKQAVAAALLKRPELKSKLPEEIIRRGLSNIIYQNTGEQ